MKKKKAAKTTPKKIPFSIDFTLIEENQKELDYLFLLLKGSEAEMRSNHYQALQMYDEALEIKPGVNEAFYAMRSLVKKNYNDLKCYYKQDALNDMICQLDELYKSRLDIDLTKVPFILE